VQKTSDTAPQRARGLDGPGMASPAGLKRPRARGVILGCALIVGLAFLMPYINLGLRKYDWAFRPLPTGPIFVLFVLIWPVNTLLRRLRPRWAFRGSELLLAYAMMAICAGLAYEGLWGYALYYTVYPTYGASPTNRYAELFIPYLPDWLQVTQPAAVRGFFETAPTWSWQPWLIPILSWSAFALTLYLFLFCLGAVVRKDWIESERLAFPLATIPSQMAGDDEPTIHGSLFRSRFLWAGFALPVAVSVLQMLHFRWPAVPYSRMYFPLGQWFSGQGPWDSLSGSSAYIGFDTIGIFGLVPVEVTLSLWLFFLLNRIEVLTFAALGFGQEGFGARMFNPGQFIVYQEAGAALMLAAIVLWRSRGYLARAFGSLLGRPAFDDPLAPMAPRTAALGMVASGAFLLWWARAAGMDLLMFALLGLVFFAYSLAVARMVAVGGVYVPDITLTPRSLLVDLRGAASIPTPTLTMFTMLRTPFMGLWKLNLLHFTVNDLKILHSARVPGRLAAVCLWLALLLMMAIVPWVTLHYCYSRGALNFDSWLFRDTGGWEFGPLVNDLRTPEPASAYLPIGLACGAAVMALLTWLHAQYIWFAVSPIGFVLGGTWGLGQRMWASAFVAWLLVTLLRRFGGLSLYRRVRPVFLGMVIGHLVTMGFRSLFDPVLGLTMHLAAWE